MALQDKPKFSLIELFITAKTRVENVAKSDDFVRDPVLNAPEWVSTYMLPPPPALEIHDIHVAERWKQLWQAWDNYYLAPGVSEKLQDPGSDTFDCRWRGGM